MTEDDTNGEILPSKTQRKREAHAQQDLGKTLTSLPAAVLQQLPLSEVLLSAVLQFQRLPNSHGARRRQLQYIGRLIRDCDTDAIARAIEDRQNASVSNPLPDLPRQLCRTILEQGDKGIQAALNQHPDLPRQQLRQLYLAWSRAQENKRASHQNKIERLLREHLASAN